MIFSPDAELQGVRLSELQAALRLASRYDIEDDQCFARLSDFYVHRSAKFFELCVNQGWLARNPFGTNWVVTEEGKDFLTARFARTISRAKAQRVLEEVVERAKALNEDAEVPLLVTKVYVFGRYLNKQKTLAELDIAVDLERRAGVSTRLDASTALYQAKKRELPAGTERRETAARAYVYRTLRGQSPVRITPAEEMLSLDCDYKALYEVSAKDFAGWALTPVCKGGSRPCNCSCAAKAELKSPPKAPRAAQLGLATGDE